MLKAESVEQATKATIALSGAGLTLTLQDVSTIAAIFVGAATTLYVLVQLAFLVRKWWLLEKTAKPPSWDSTK